MDVGQNETSAAEEGSGTLVDLNAPIVDDNGEQNTENLDDTVEKLLTEDIFKEYNISDPGYIVMTEETSTQIFPSVQDIGFHNKSKLHEIAEELLNETRLCFDNTESVISTSTDEEKDELLIPDGDGINIAVRAVQC